MPQDLNTALQALNGTQLSSVEFLFDYLQLRFEGRCLTAYSPVTVSGPFGNLCWGQKDYRDALCDQITKVVIEARCDGKEIRVSFENGSALLLSLRANDYTGPEAFEYTDENGSLWGG
jgi:hypothetical protein